MTAAFPLRRRPGWPLLATLGAHLLLAWSWRIAHPPPPSLHGERVVDLIPVPAPVPAAPRLQPPPPARPTAPVAARARTPAPAARAAEPEAIATPVAVPAGNPFAADAPPEPAVAAPGALLGQARQDARAIDRELRKGKSGVPDSADTPWTRFRDAAEGAFKDRGLGITSESYTTPDGQIIYRYRRGGKYRCRSSGGVPPRIGGAVGGGEVLFDAQGGEGRAGEVPCPNHAQWKRD